jgi:flagellar capping protein FliD
MSKTPSQRNQDYLNNNDLDNIHFTLPKETKSLFYIATRKNDTDASNALRKFIHKYNAAYINKNGNKIIASR